MKFYDTNGNEIFGQILTITSLDQNRGVFKDNSGKIFLIKIEDEMALICSDEITCEKAFMIAEEIIAGHTPEENNNILVELATTLISMSLEHHQVIVDQERQLKRIKGYCSNGHHRGGATIRIFYYCQCYNFKIGNNEFYVIYSLKKLTKQVRS